MIKLLVKNIKKLKTPRPYNLFVKQKYSLVKDKYEFKERMKTIIVLWKEHNKNE